MKSQELHEMSYRKNLVNSFCEPQESGKMAIQDQAREVRTVISPLFRGQVALMNG